MNTNHSNIFLLFKKRWVAVFVIILLATLLNFWNNDFPLGYHADEVKKVKFILTGTQDFHHPVLMLNIVRLANLFFGYTAPDQVVVLGRTIMALFGVLLVLAFYILALRMLTPLYALLATLTLAVTPILVVHAHYLKEDILFSFFSLLSLLAYFSFLKNTGRLRILCLGLSFGFALSAQYKALLLLPVFLIGPLLFRPGNRFLIYKNIFFAMAVSAVIFLVINYSMLNDFVIFKKAISYTYYHVQSGHNLRIYPLPHFFSFHLLNSIVPGITPLVTVLSLLFICFFTIKWKRLVAEERILLCYLGIFYLVQEITPMKPYPDFMRYMIPIIPVLIYFLYKGLAQIEQHLSQTISKIAIYIILLLTFIVPLQSSIRLDYHLNRDTREIAEEWLKKNGRFVVFEMYSTKILKERGCLADYNLQKLRSFKVKYLVASSFLYERYEYGAQLSDQKQKVYRRHNAYKELFLHPYIEIKPVYKSFAFSNPTIRIIDISENSTDS